MDIIPIKEWSSEIEMCKNCGTVVAEWMDMSDGPICNQCKEDFYEKCPCCDGYRLNNEPPDGKRLARALSKEELNVIVDTVIEDKIETKGW